MRLPGPARTRLELHPSLRAKSWRSVDLHDPEDRASVSFPEALSVLNLSVLGHLRTQAASLVESHLTRAVRARA